MTKYRVQSPHFTLGEPGDVVDLDDVPGLNVRALVKARAVVPVPDRKPRKTVTSTDTSEGDDV